ncbi:suppressor of fused domain protein [Brucepastera parasyntrophica]|uniref:suppressor of fused domain protein n=1 Tax=Brucepastera parasyntrophica TaxID=2880008 RepID=UPI00210A7E0B|nr:suppressor of fused domain protein [Brucepastera parasyntrophica]ULQ58581.1 suppressor of fused domain protein [Brucepastera parasyntrophica]
MDPIQELLSKIQLWHENDEHQKIVDVIEVVPDDKRTYELISVYARALNNLERYEEAFNLLMAIQEQGKEDALWHFRTGYALYYLEREAEAAGHFQRAIDLGDEEEDTITFLNASLEEAEARNSGQQDTPELYTEEEVDCIESHVEEYFGINENVFHELVSPDIHVDILIIEPVPERNYYVLVTMGMGAHRMNVPEELEDYQLDRAELVICLPPDWKFDSEDEKWYWPLRWLKILARLPGEYDTWLGWGHTVPNDGPFAENTRLSSILLINPWSFGEESYECKMPDGSIVNFYQLIPLYEEEMQYKIDNDAEKLLELFDGEDMEYVNIHRENVCKD